MDLPATGTLIATAITGLVTSVFTYIISRRNSKRSDFDALIAANEEFRDEIRSDLESTKRDLKDAQAHIARLEALVSDKNAKIYELQTHIVRLETMLNLLQKQTGNDIK